MDVPWWCWIVGFAGIWIVNFGLWWTLTPCVIIIVFCFGAIYHMYSKTLDPLTAFHQNAFSDINLKTGIRKIVDEINKEKPVHKFDARLTGSQIIDESLHEIINYIMRDYISPWYGKLSANEEFEISVRESIQKVVIDVSARIKDVPWISYLTTRLVDDAACHLRLYRQACERTKVEVDVKRPTPQSLASFKSATQQGYSLGHSRSNSDGGGKTANAKGHARNCSLGEKPLDLVTAFFQVEAELPHKKMCHDLLCTNKEFEKRYLDDIIDIILYLILPDADFQCLPARLLLREIFIGGVLLPAFDMVTNPDFVNRCLIWLCRDFGLSSEAFLATLRATVHRDELLATLDIVNKELVILRGRDSGGDDDAEIKQQLNSLLYVKKFIDSKLQGGFHRDRTSTKTKLAILPLSFLLRNNLALSYLIDYLSTVDMQNYIFLYLSIESWRCSARAERQRIDSPLKKISKSGTDNLREAATTIYQQFMMDDVPGRVRLDPKVEEQLHLRLTRESISDNWFDEVMTALHKKLQEKYIPEFYRSSIYVKLLSDLDMLKDNDQDEDSQSPDSVSLAESLEDDDGSRKNKEPESGEGKFHLKVEIIDSGVVQDRGKTYGIYALSVTKIYENGFTERWHVYRRYSDFYDLQQKVKDAYSDLGKLPFPGKKTFNNMDATTLAKRKKMLNDYLQILLHSGFAETHHRLPQFLLSFLEPGDYDKAGSLGSAIEFVVSPIKSSVRSVTAAVKTVPDNLLSTVDGLSRSLQSGKKDPSRLAAELLMRKEENVPLRIMLLLMDEVFDLQSRNQWLRRHIVTLLRQMFGDIVNRKILDYVEEITAPDRVAEYLITVKDSLWPSGRRPVSQPDRDEATRLRTRVLTKTALLSSLPDDLKHLLGSDTTRRGFLRVYSTFQHPDINRRLLYVLLEGVLELIFPPLTTVLTKLSQRREKSTVGKVSY